VAYHFISDLHLSPHEPAITERFLQYLSQYQDSIAGLFILGDFFDVWLGMDQIHSSQEQVLRSLKLYSKKFPIYFMAGNRDFLVSKSVLLEHGCQLMSDPTVIELFGQKIVLSHGDLLCTRDFSYQIYRKIVRNAFFTKSFLKLPIRLRQMMARSVKSQSKKKKLVDVCDKTVSSWQDNLGYELMIHGHTHKQMLHTGSESLRAVLGDWKPDIGNAFVLTGRKEHKFITV